MKNRDKEEKGWEPQSTHEGDDALTTEERSLDIGESGQFAPGGYYNQQSINAPDRSTLDDDDIIPPSRR